MLVGETAMEAFVDLTYRGLSLARRIKLTQVRPTTGYLEHATPMPVGTAVSIKTDDGVVFDAVVVYVYEQIGGSERAPGMTVKPTLGDAALVAWWSQHVALPELDPKRFERGRSPSVRPRSVSVPPQPIATQDSTQPITFTPKPPVVTPALAPVPVPVPIPPIEPSRNAPAMNRDSMVASGEITPKPRGEKTTTVMNAVDQELLEQLTRNPDDIDQLVNTSEHEVVDDGQRTIVMDAIDPAALGLDVTASGSIRAVQDDSEAEDGDDEPDKPDAANDDKKPKGSVKRRKKRR